MDKASNKKTDELIYDIAFNPKVLAEIVTSRELQEMLNRLCFDYLEDIVGITVTKKQSYTKVQSYKLVRACIYRLFPGWIYTSMYTCILHNIIMYKLSIITAMMSLVLFFTPLPPFTYTVREFSWFCFAIEVQAQIIFHICSWRRSLLVPRRSYSTVWMRTGNINFLKNPGQTLETLFSRR